MVWMDCLLMIYSVFITILQDLMGINFISTSATYVNCRKYFFSQQIINDWNKLPCDIIESPNIGTFKSKLDVFWKIVDLIMHR